MLKPEDAISKARPPKWFATTVLVFLLFTFSGYAPQSVYLGCQPIKTEVAQSRNSAAHTTGYFKKVFYKLHCPIRPSGKQLEEFFNSLIHQENKISVKLKGDFHVLPENTEAQGFLIFYSTDLSEGFAMTT